MKKRIMTETRIFRSDDFFDLDVCSLDVYEIVIQCTGATSVTLFPAGFAPGGSAGLAGKVVENGIRLQRLNILRLYAGNLAPRADAFNIIFDAGAGTRGLVIMLYGIPKDTQ